LTLRTSTSTTNTKLKSPTLATTHFPGEKVEAVSISYCDTGSSSFLVISLVQIMRRSLAYLHLTNKQAATVPSTVN